MTRSHNQRPNLLVINVDQQRYDSLGCTGNPIVKTPNLDRLARAGLTCHQAYTPIPLCCPARQSFLAGVMAETHGCLWNYDMGWTDGLPPAPDMWPFRFKDAGYATAYVGKWHVHPKLNPTQYGYDVYVPEGKYPLLRPPRKVWSSMDMIRGIGLVDEGDLQTSYTHGLTREALELIRRFHQAGTPWHVRLDLMNPHLPCIPTPRFAAMYRAKDIPPWGSFTDQFTNKPFIQGQMLRNWDIEDWDWAMWSRFVAQYYAIISQSDDAFGMLFDYLDEQHLTGNTVIVYTTDHGDMTGSHRMIDKHCVMYDDIVHVPLIVRWDGVIPPGSRSDDFINHYLDLAVTFCELADAPVPASYQGLSLLGQWRGQDPVRRRPHVVSTYNGNGGQFGLYTERMLRDRRYKLVWNLTDVDEFYDMEKDPWELVNLAADPAFQSLVDGYRRRLFDELAALGDPVTRGPWQKLIREKGKG